jgi:hypothetical protein
MTTHRPLRCCLGWHDPLYYRHPVVLDDCVIYAQCARWRCAKVLWKRRSGGMRMSVFE